MTPRPPSDSEHRLVARCILAQGILIGTRQDIWGHATTWRVLGTWRECIDAITLLIGGGHAVQASFVKACVMQADGLSEPPFCLDEVAEFLVDDSEARAHWQGMCRDDRFPHTCFRCGAAAFVGLNQVDCKARCVGR